MKNICYNCFREKPDNEQTCSFCGYTNGSGADRYPLALPEGSVLAGRYIVGRVLGQGGFGITYIARDYQTGERIALKEFFPDTVALRDERLSVRSFTGEKQEFFQYGKECFLAEAETLSKFIGNDNICRIYSYFEENNTAYFAMEYIEGESLQELLNRRGGKIGFEEAKEILLPVMDALSAVHAQGIIHRDISPDNIIIEADGTVKLLDFGAARYSLGDKSRSLDVVLKHGYAPKEQYTRRGRQGPFTDVYSLSATFYRAITGRTPPDSIDRLEEDDLIAPSILCPGIPACAEEALLKGLAVSVGDRYHTIEELKAALTSQPPAFPAASAQTVISPKTVPASNIPNQTAMHPDPQTPAPSQTAMRPDGNTPRQMPPRPTAPAGQYQPTYPVKPDQKPQPQHTPATSFDRIDEEEEKNKPKNQLTKKEVKQLLKDPEKFKDEKDHIKTDSYKAAEQGSDKMSAGKFIKGLIPMVIGVIVIGIIIWVCVDFTHTEIVETDDYQLVVSKTSVEIKKYIGSEENVTIPAEFQNKPVTSIGPDAFAKTNVYEVTIPESVTAIKDAAFSNCTHLHKFIILLPSSLNSIGDSVFSDCYGITSFYFPDSVESVDTGMFFMTDFRYVSIPKHLEGGEFFKYLSEDCEIEVRE